MRMADINISPESRRIEGNATPTSTDLRPRETVIWFSEPINPTHTRVKYALEKFAGEG